MSWQCEKNDNIRFVKSNSNSNRMRNTGDSDSGFGQSRKRNAGRKQNFQNCSLINDRTGDEFFVEMMGPNSGRIPRGTNRHIAAATMNAVDNFNERNPTRRIQVRNWNAIEN